LAIEELALSVTKVTESLSKAMANEKDLRKKFEQYRLGAESWTQKATYALRTNDEELAKQALAKKALDQKQAEQFYLLSENARKNTELLKQQLDQLKIKLDEAKVKKNILIAQAESAKAQTEIARQLGGLDNDALSNFARYEEKINAMTHEAEAMSELVGMNNELEREFQKLETNTTVSHDLEELKRKLAEENATGATIVIPSVPRAEITQISAPNTVHQLPSNTINSSNFDEKFPSGKKDDLDNQINQFFNK
jgi:phage shock protein A